jgi:hypothetical protein
MAGPAEVEACRNQFHALKGQVQSIQTSYKQQAGMRIDAQQKMARMVQTVQERSGADVELVEDVIVISLQSETQALHARGEIPNPPVIDVANQPSGRTSSAEEAVAVYTKQIETLEQDRAYRQCMLDTETAMANVYTKGIQEILAVMRIYCKETALVGQLEGIAE